jgi:hypothetical protein
MIYRRTPQFNCEAYMSLSNLFARVGLPELLTTAELAGLERIVPQTIRKNYCQKGHHHGIKPIKLPSGGLRWRSADVQELLNGGANV